MMRYTVEHLWVRLDDDGLTAVSGITHYALESLGELVTVELAARGRQEGGAVVGTVESAKTASDLYMPLRADIVDVNPALADGMECVNADPQGQGWLFRLANLDREQYSALLDEAAYQRLIG